MAKENTKVADPNAVEEKLVPVRMLVSEAGLGLRTGEIRGFPESIAAKMIERKHAEPISTKKSAE